MLISRKFARAFQSSEKCVSISRSFILMACGDIKLAAYLSQVFYWHIPSNSTNKYKLRVKIGDEFWLAKADKDWFNECFLSYDEIRGKNGAKAKAVNLGLIRSINKKWFGNPTTHITLTNKFERVLNICSEYLLDIEDDEFPATKEALVKVVKSLKIYDNQLCVNHAKRNESFTHNDTSKSRKTYKTDITTDITTDTSFSKEKENASGEATVKGKSDCLSKRILPKIVKKEKQDDSTKSSLDPKNRTIVPKKKTPKSKYKNNVLGEKIYIQLLNAKIGVINHAPKTQARITAIDLLQALISPTLKNPYQNLPNVPEEYIDFEWDLDSLIEIFEYHMKHAEKSKQRRSIGDFIYSKGFNGHDSWSPLIFWGQKMLRTAEGELTEEGKALFKSFKYFEIRDLGDLESRVINKLANEIKEISPKYVFVENEGLRTDTYRMGIVSLVAKYIKDITNNREYNLAWINKNGFVKNEIIPTAIKRNILKLKNG